MRKSPNAVVACDSSPRRGELGVERFEDDVGDDIEFRSRSDVLDIDFDREAKQFEARRIPP